MKFRLSLVVLIFFLLLSHAMAQPQPPVDGKDPVTVSKIQIHVGPGGVSLHAENAELKDVFAELSRKTGVIFTAGDQLDDKINIDIKGVGLEEILKKICANHAVVYTLDAKTGAYRIVSGYGFEATGENTTSGIKTGKADLFSPVISKISPINMAKTATMPVNGLSTDKKKYDPKGRSLYKPGELLLKAKKDVLPADIHRLHTALGSRVLETIKSLQLQKIVLTKGMDEDVAATLYMQSGLFDVAEKHALRYKNNVPNDPLLNDQWGMTRIQAPAAWDITTGNNEVVVAVIDTGVDYNHPDLADNIWINAVEYNGTDGVDDDGNGKVDDVHGWDFAGDGVTEDNDPMAYDSHGTHVAGIIAARGNNNLGVTGVCWNLKIMPVKIQADGATSMDTFDIIKGMEYAMDNGARVINCSYGGAAFVYSERELLLQLGAQKGMLAVCAAGNDGNNNDGDDKNYPASYDLDNILAVAASNQSDQLSYYSNYGNETVDLMAPGDYIKSTVLDNTYNIMSGTSMATPHVTGIAGLLLSINPVLDYAGLKTIIMDTVDPVDGAVGLLVTGGRVNAYAAVTAVCIDESDCDNDGMGDSWEETYFGSIGVKDGTDDSDQDGYSDLQEFLNNTDPNEQNDPGGQGYDPATDDLSISGKVVSDNENVFVSLIIDGEIVDVIHVETARETDFKFDLPSDPKADAYMLTAVDNDAYREIIVDGTFLPIVGADIDLTSEADIVHLTFDDDIAYEATAYTNGSELIFAITAENTAGPVTEFPNGLILSLPFNLQQVAPGEFESGDAAIYHAGTRAGLIAGEGTAVPVEDIIAVDYSGDGETGTVTYRIYAVSVFGIGVSAENSSSSVSSGDGSGGGGCFISGVYAMSTIKPSVAALVLAGFILAFNRIIRILKLRALSP